MSRGRFLMVLGLIVLLGAGVRTAFVLGVARHDRQFYDAFYYELQADVLADGKGYTEPSAYLPGADHVARPAADHPPLTATVLGRRGVALPPPAAGPALHHRPGGCGDGVPARPPGPSGGG